MERQVLVTGGTGYIAGELIEQLLARGWTVRTTVRNKAKSEPVLRARWPDAGGRLAVFEVDLQSDAGWAEASAGCSHVAHVASPFPMDVPKHEDELIVPAREGTLRVLRFAHQAGTTRFVQTSSSAAIMYGHPREQTRFDEGDWSDVKASDIGAYAKSKTIAERAARDWAAQHAPEMEFCSINPVMVLGPVASADYSTSVEVIRMLLDRAMPLLPPIGFGVVDVRDVAKAHVLALEAPAEKIRGERFALSDSFLWLADIATLLRERLGEAGKRIPTGKLPAFLIPPLSLFMKELKQIRSDTQRKRDVDGSHASEVLGFEYIPAAQSLEDTARSLIEHGLVKGQ